MENRLAIANKPFAWSFSALTEFENCPKKYFHLKVAKDVKDEDNQWSGEGKQVHDALFHRVIDGTPLPLATRHLEAIAVKFADAEGDKYGEMKFALTRDFEPTEFFAHDVYIRAIIDLLIVRGTHAIIIDWKTGKVKDDFTQIKMSAAVLSRFMPELQTFTVAYVWLKAKNVSQQNITKQELVGVWSDLIPRAGKIESALKTTSFSAKPSGLCKYCPVKQCPHHP
jgi:hypothetical protein